MAQLVRANLHSLVSDKSALGLVAVGALVLAVAATLGAFGFFGLFFFIGFVLVPIFGTSIGAVQISGERVSGYAAVLHTAPIMPAAYYAARYVTAFLWTSLAMLLTLPYGLLFALFLGPAFLAEFLPWVPVGLLVCAFSASLGLLLSVLVGRRGLLPSAFAGIGVALAVVLVPLLLEFLPESMREAVGWMTRLSPLVDVLAREGGLQVRALDAEGAVSYLLVGTYAALFAGLGYVFYARLQNPEGWDAPGRTIAAALAVGFVLVLAPAALVGGDPAADEFRGVPGGPPVGLNVELSEPGRPARDPSTEGFFSATLRPGEARALDVHLHGFASPGGPGDQAIDGLTNVTVRFVAQPGYRIAFEPAEVRIGAWAARPCERAVDGPDGPREPDPEFVGCREFPAQVLPVRMTVTSLPSLQSHPGGLFGVQLASDQVTTVFWPGNANFRVDVPAYPWWGAFAVWLLVVAAFAAPQAVRRGRLGRKPVPAVVQRKPTIVTRR